MIPGQVGRYTSEFYPMSTGDNFTKMGYPCVLFEAGHFANDYQRNTTRKYNALAILAGLNALATQDKFPFDNYLSIPQNGQKYLDILIRNVQLKNEDKFSFVDLGIYFEDEYNEENNTVDQMAKIVEIGDLRKFIGHLEIDAKKQIYKGVQKNYPILNQLATFEIGSIKFKNGRLID